MIPVTRPPTSSYLRVWGFLLSKTCEKSPSLATHGKLVSPQGWRSPPDSAMCGGYRGAITFTENPEHHPFPAAARQKAVLWPSRPFLNWPHWIIPGPLLCPQCRPSGAIQPSVPARAGTGLPARIQVDTWSTFPCPSNSSPPQTPSLPSWCQSSLAGPRGHTVPGSITRSLCSSRAASGSAVNSGTWGLILAVGSSPW